MNSFTNHDVPPSFDQEAFIHALQLSNSSIFPMVLNTAVELGLFEIIARAGPGERLSARDIASLLPIRENENAPAMLDHVLHLLACNSLLTCTLRAVEDGEVEGMYGMAPAGNFFVRETDGGSVAPLVVLSNGQNSKETWTHLKDAILEGGTAFERAHGMPFFQYLETNPSIGNCFDGAMKDYSILIMNKVVNTYKGFEGLKTLVDVGGGMGTTLNMIVSKYPSMKGINYDLPHVIENAPSYHGIEHVKGDMLLSIPEGEPF